MRLLSNKVTLAFGHFMIGVMHLGIVLSKVMHWNYAAIVFMVLTLVSYELSTGPVCYIHVSEVEGNADNIGPKWSASGPIP